MSLENNGGQAFPSPMSGDPESNYFEPPETGMTLRDHFASHVPQSYFDGLSEQTFHQVAGDFREGESRLDPVDRVQHTYRAMAKLAYMYADAMLEARQS